MEEIKQTIGKAFAFTPNELKTIEVDVEKGIFKVNGIPFGDCCTEFSISCKAVNGYEVRMDIDTTVKLASYDMEGNKKNDHTYTKHGQ